MTKASVVIPTRGRRGELALLLRSLRAQTVPLDILVMDDGASDETKRLVECEFPEAVYWQINSDKGPTFQRNRGIELAKNNIVFPLDDDTELPSPRTIEQTVQEFSDPRVAAVGIPFINIRQDSLVRQRAPNDAGVYLIDAFVGASHAIRRDVFLRVGGYREHFFRAGEEGDLCLRMLQAGYITIAGSADAIHHSELPDRDFARWEYYGRRNDILFVWHNAPLPIMPVYLVGTTVNGCLWALKTRRLRTMLRGAAAGYWDIFRGRSSREPVKRTTYSLYMRLKRNVFTALSDVEMEIPPIR